MKRAQITNVWLATLALAAAVRAGDEAPPPPLDQALRDNAPKILDKLRDKKYKNVGVLKFLVDPGKGQPRDNVGPLNTSLADRLEVALVLALKDDSLGIIANATKSVRESANKRANHLTEEGRKELFDIKKGHFHVPWNAGAGVEPDAFLTGVARLAPDRRSLRVTVQAFDRADPATMWTVCEFPASSDLRTLTETGVTFAVRGAFDDPILIAKATEAAPQPDDKPDDLKKKADLALADLDKSPVKLVILYGGQEQHVQAAPVGVDKTGVLLRVPTPKTDQTVVFRLTNTDRDNTYGVVLKLNGQNTIKYEQQDALDCKKWILNGGESVAVSGYQLDDKDRDPFKVHSPQESAFKEVYYGDNAGTINLVVFRAGKPEEVLVKNDDPLASISRGMLSLQGEPMATELKTFQAQLQKETTAEQKEARSRGLIAGAGNVGNNPVKKVTFVPVPVPVLSATIRYYEPRK